MVLTLRDIKALYQFKVVQVALGENVVKQGKCSAWARRKELQNEKDVIYIKLQIKYNGTSTKSFLYVQFHLEDSEGYFSDASPPEDYLEKALKQGEEANGGLLFSYYRDITPARLWFDTKICYENSGDPILIDIPLPLPEAESRTQFFAKEEVAQHYTQEIANRVKTRPARETETFIEEISRFCGIPYKKVPHGYVLRVILPEGRKQNVILNFSGRDESNHDLITIGTICAQASSRKNDRAFLKLNTKMLYGAVGITNVEGKDFYVILETYPISVITKEVVCDAIKNIAAKGDWMEKTLTGGQDIQ